MTTPFERAGFRPGQLLCLQGASADSYPEAVGLTLTLHTDDRTPVPMFEANNGQRLFIHVDHLQPAPSATPVFTAPDVTNIAGWNKAHYDYLKAQPAEQLSETTKRFIALYEADEIARVDVDATTHIEYALQILDGHEPDDAEDHFGLTGDTHLGRAKEVLRAAITDPVKRAWRDVDTESVDIDEFIDARTDDLVDAGWVHPTNTHNDFQEAVEEAGFIHEDDLGDRGYIHKDNLGEHGYIHEDNLDEHGYIHEDNLGEHGYIHEDEANSSEDIEDLADAIAQKKLEEYLALPDHELDAICAKLDEIRSAHQ